MKGPLLTLFASLSLSFLVFSCAHPAADSSADREQAPIADKAPQQASAAAAAGVKKDCEADGFCTREYVPTTCRYMNKEFAATNPCEARKLVRVYACEAGKDYDEAKVKCAANKALQP